MYQKYFKRLFDFVLSLIALIILSPIMLIVALFVRVKLGCPVIFKQQRPGWKEKIFTMYKFRTMTDERDKFGELLPDKVRLTKFGKFLRSTSLDELPELWNILKGDMSFVGPRPQLVKDLVFFDDSQLNRQKVRPGLTGLAQVNGRNNISWEDKLSFDIIYINKITFFKDAFIMMKTLVKVFNREDINTIGTETAIDLGDYLLTEGRLDASEYESKIKLYEQLIAEDKK